MECKLCMFYYNEADNEFGSGISECRRNPPTLHAVNSPHDAPEYDSYWPDVESDYWCGEFKFDISKLDLRSDGYIPPAETPVPAVEPAVEHELSPTEVSELCERWLQGESIRRLCMVYGLLFSKTEQIVQSYCSQCKTVST